MPEVFMDFITLQKILLNNNFFLYIEYMYFDYPALFEGEQVKELV